MSGEFDPAAELGLFPDKIFVCNCYGFLTMNNYHRDLCARFIRNGNHFYNIVSRYDELCSYILNRENISSGDMVKWMAPYLKANGATDHLVERYGRADMKIMPGAEEAIRYISRLMPSFICTIMYEHGVIALREMLGEPECTYACSMVDFDGCDVSRSEARRCREMGDRANTLRIPKTKYPLNVSMEVDPDDVRVIRMMDDATQVQIQTTPTLMKLMDDTTAMSSHKKAYNLLDIRRQTNIDLDSTVYIGGDGTDFQAMDLVRDAGGLSMAFNATDFGVRGANVAVMSNDSTVGAVLVEQFYDKGIEAVRELANNWDRKYLKNADFPDENVVSRMLAAHPRKLPEVVLVDRHNVDEIAERSDAYRKKLFGSRSTSKHE